MKIINNNESKPHPISVSLAIKLTEESSEWRKSIKVGDLATFICIQGDTGVWYPYSFFDDVGSFSPRRIKILDTTLCKMGCEFCNSNMGFKDILSGKVYLPSCRGFSDNTGSWHSIHPANFLFTEKVLLFNSDNKGDTR